MIKEERALVLRDLKRERRQAAVPRPEVSEKQQQQIRERLMREKEQMRRRQTDEELQRSADVEESRRIDEKMGEDEWWRSPECQH